MNKRNRLLLCKLHQLVICHTYRPEHIIESITIRRKARRDVYFSCCKRHHDLRTDHAANTIHSKYCIGRARCIGRNKRIIDIPVAYGSVIRQPPVKHRIICVQTNCGAPGNCLVGGYIGKMCVCGSIYYCISSALTGTPGL